MNFNHVPNNCKTTVEYKELFPLRVIRSKSSLRFLLPFFSLLTLLWIWIPSVSAAVGDEEFYSQRPNIMDVEPHFFAADQLPRGWDMQREGHFQAIAELFGMYPDPSQHFYFLARDAELLYDFAKLMAETRPEFQTRIHLLNISRANMSDLHLKDYLAQEGISELTFIQGQKALFVDTGFSGTISQRIAGQFPAFSAQISTHLMASNNPLHPSTRTFLLGFTPAAADLDPGCLHGSIISYEHMPRSTYRATAFKEVSGKWEPMGHIGIDADGKVSIALAYQYMQDLKAFALEPSIQARFDTSLHFWRQLFGIAQAGGVSELTAQLHALVVSQVPLQIAMVRDFIETVRRHYPSLSGVIQEDQLGLKPIYTVNVRSNKTEIIQKYPQWEEILTNPATGIAKLVLVQDLHTLAAILDVVRDDEVMTLAVESLSQDFSYDKRFQAQVLSLLDVLIEKGHEITLEILAMEIFSAPHTIHLGKQLSALIEKAHEDVPADWYETDEQPDFFTPMQTLATEVFSQPHAVVWGEQLTALIAKADDITLQDLVRHAFSQPHAVAWGEQLSAVIAKADAETLHAIAQYVFSQPYAAAWGEQLSALIAKADAKTLRALEQYVSSQPHAVYWGAQLELISSHCPVLTADEVSGYLSSYCSGAEAELQVLPSCEVYTPMPVEEHETSSLVQADQNLCDDFAMVDTGFTESDEFLHPFVEESSVTSVESALQLEASPDPSQVQKSGGMYHAKARTPVRVKAARATGQSMRESNRLASARHRERQKALKHALTLALEQKTVEGMALRAEMQQLLHHKARLIQSVKEQQR